MTVEPPAPDGRVPVLFVVAHRAAELLADELFGLGAAAVAELPSDLEGHVALVADLTVGDAARLGGDRAWAARAGVRDVRRLEEDRAWSAAWRDHAQIWRCGPDVVLRPAWIEPDGDSARIEIVLDPGDAFGSGSHPTTRRCVEVVAELVHDGDRVLDVGCGSGVLAVAAALAGAASVLAVDIDPEAVRVTPQVAARNGVAERVEVRAGSIEQADGRYDLVLANLLVPIVEELGEHLVAAVRPGGHLVVSGLLVAHRDRATRALDGLEVVAGHDDGDWSTLVLASPEEG